MTPRGTNSDLAPTATLDANLSRTIDACCDEHATARDIAELQRALAGRPERVRAYVERVGLHVALDWWVTSAEAPPRTGAAPSQPAAFAETRARRASWVEPAVYAALTIGASLLLAFSIGGAGAASSVASARIARHSDDASWVVLRGDSRPEAMRVALASGETVHLTRGQVGMEFTDGAEVTLTGPAVLQVLAPDRALAVKGKLTASVSEAAVGFSVDTPHTQVIDLGTRFGMEVDDLGQTDVVVFEGEVDIAYGPVTDEPGGWKRRVMRMGEAVRVDDRGDARRIMSIPSSRFGEAGPQPARRLITEVRDNIRGELSWNYYEIVHGALAEDALAYVDRESHEWNGVDAAGMPAGLVGGDYVKMFNDDKMAEEFELTVTLAAPAMVYVLFDDRVPPPEWLVARFEDTGEDIGLDRGRYRNLGNQTMNEEYSAGVGPGVSVEDTASVWVRRVESPQTIRLGATETSHNQLNMYGIVATPLSD